MDVTATKINKNQFLNFINTIFFYPSKILIKKIQ